MSQPAGEPLTIGIIGGAGWLGGAIARAIVAAGVVRPRNLALSYRGRQPAGLRDCRWTRDNQELADRSRVLIVSVRPGDWPAVAADARGRLVISVMAGVRLEALAAHHRTERVVRALPNAAAEVAKSYTPWVAAGATDDDRRIVRAIFGACGIEDEVGSEGDIDYLTGLTGSGPAFPALLASAMVRHAVAHGLPPQTARRGVNAVLVGAGRLLELRDACPEDTVRAFLDYRGTTAAAIEAMRGAEFDAAVAKGLAAAFGKSISMGLD